MIHMFQLQRNRILIDEVIVHITTSFWKPSLSVAVAIFITASSIAFAGSGDGPRSFPLLPKDINLLTVYALGQNGDQLLDPGQRIPDADIDAYIGILQYTRTFDVKGHLGAAFVGVVDGIECDHWLVRVKVDDCEAYISHEWLPFQ